MTEARFEPLSISPSNLDFARSCQEMTDFILRSFGVPSRLLGIMTHHDAFLADIIANPEDDTPRLIYADWLEEHGGQPERERAEFIRVQCQLAKGLRCAYEPGTYGDPFGLCLCLTCELRRCEQSLLKHFDFESLLWLGYLHDCNPIGHVVDSKHTPPRTWHGGWQIPTGGVPDLCVNFRRGFPEVLECSAASWLQVADELTARFPIREVMLTTPIDLEIEHVPSIRGAAEYTRWRISGRTWRRSFNLQRDLVRAGLRGEWPRIKWFQSP